MNFILEGIFLSSASLALWLNQEELLKINYTSIKEWTWANIQRPRKALLAECVNAKALRSCNTQWKPQSPLGIGQWRRLVGPERYLFIARISQFCQGWMISLEGIKYSSGISFFTKQKKITLYLSTECMPYLFSLQLEKEEGRKGGAEEGRREKSDKSSFFVQKAVWHLRWG